MASKRTHDTAKVAQHIENLNSFYVKYAKGVLGIDRPIVKITPNQDLDGMPDVSIQIIDARVYVETNDWKMATVFEIDVELKAGIEARINIYDSQVTDNTRTLSIINNSTNDWYLVELNLREYQDKWSIAYDKQNQFKIYMKNILNGRRSIDCDSYQIVS